MAHLFNPIQIGGRAAAKSPGGLGAGADHPRFGWPASRAKSEIMLRASQAQPNGHAHFAPERLGSP